jgi:hypothetical protein
MIKMTDTKKILWENVQSLMLDKYGKDNLWQFCKFVGLGPATGTRIKECKTSVGIEILEKIAGKFDLHPWHLLIPNLDIKNPPVVLITHTEQALYTNIKKAYKAISDIKQ